jgi:CBS domain-containing protein
MTDAERCDEFLALYNEVDHHVKKIVDVKGSVPFWKRLRMGAKQHAGLKRYLDDLLEFHELRNAIVHHRAYPKELIAVPTERTVALMRDIVQALAAPAHVIPAFAREIHVFVPTEPLTGALAYMSKHDFRQIVVRDAGALKLVTSLGVALWLIDNAKGEIVNLKETSLGDVLSYEHDDSVAFLPQDASLDTARGIFEEANVRKPRRLYAILITEHGTPQEEPLGIITPRELLGNDK